MTEVSPKVSGRGPRNQLWKPGQSGNPKGRPPGLYARDLARQHTDLAIETLVKALGNQRTMVAAAVALLDRGWGKPKEQHENLNVNFDGMGIDAPQLPEDLDTWLARRRSQLDKLN